MVYLIWLIGVLALDQFSKWLVLQNIQLFDVIPLLPNCLNLTHWQNRGGAFGILQGQGLWLAWVAVLVSVTIVVLLVKYPRQNRLINAGLALIAGGALGNLIDRIRLEHVVDFIQVCANGVCAFPVFNVADSAIVVGTGLILWTWLRQKRPVAKVDQETSAHPIED